MATATKRWTLEELHSLPDDGNKYELINGELFVTPPPTDQHETILARLTRILDPYVAQYGLGYVYHPRAVIRTRGSEVEPDLMVRRPREQRDAKWEDAPMAILVVEVLSPYTRRRDQLQKRDHYMSVGVAEYWIIDPDDMSVRQIRPGQPDDVPHASLTWFPTGAAEPLAFEVGELFM
jgi:Uma2 family endonuclease